MGVEKASDEIATVEQKWRYREPTAGRPRGHSALRLPLAGHSSGVARVGVVATDIYDVLGRHVLVFE
jgi:hypothetical protein